VEEDRVYVLGREKKNYNLQEKSVYDHDKPSLHTEVTLKNAITPSFHVKKFYTEDSAFTKEISDVEGILVSEQKEKAELFIQLSHAQSTITVLRTENQKLANAQKQILKELDTAREQFACRQSLIEKISRAHSFLKREALSTPPIIQTLEKNVNEDKTEPFIWDAEQDKKYEHNLPEMAHVLHVFHQEWFGIRAAVGSLAGKKLAVSAENTINQADIRKISVQIAEVNYKKLFFMDFLKIR
jgi:hypothetical protein